MVDTLSFYFKFYHFHLFICRTQSINLYSFIEAELSITLSHRHNTLAGVSYVLCSHVMTPRQP